MAKGIFQRLNGKTGEIRIDSLGVLVGTMTNWTLSRRGDDVPGEGLYDLYAVFSYVNPHLWSDKDYVKTITVKIGKDEFSLAQEDGFPTIMDGRKSMRMQGVRLCQ
jgi:hypothetical protein